MNGKIGTRLEKGFTLIELIVVIAIIGIMAALIVAVVANAAQDTKLVIARQQQAVVQEALNAWISSYSQTTSLSSARTAYAAASAAGAKFNLISGYLDATTISSFTTGTANFSATSASIRTDAMASQGKALVFSDWTTANYPAVNMQ